MERQKIGYKFYKYVLIVPHRVLDCELKPNDTANDFFAQMFCHTGGRHVASLFDGLNNVLLKIDAR